MLEYTLYKAYQALFTFLTVKLGILLVFKGTCNYAHLVLKSQDLYSIMKFAIIKMPKDINFSYTRDKGNRMLDRCVEDPLRVGILMLFTDCPPVLNRERSHVLGLFI